MSGRAVRISPIDGKLPNLALMRIAAWEREQGADVHWRFGHQRELDEPDYDAVYASAIFETSAKAVALFRRQWPDAIIGGSGVDEKIKVEDAGVPSQFTELDYTGYPEFTASIGYGGRGCRFMCDHCGVPRMEGNPWSAASIAQIWRGDGYPKHLHLLDNDFFGNPEWRARVREIVDGGFKVCLNQGVTARVMNAEQAEAVVEMHPWDDQFKRARLYVAWDSLDQERAYMRGIDALERAGWKPDWVFSYMLVGHDPDETWERIWHRFNAMVARGIRPFPMVYNRLFETDPERFRQLKRFQRWVVTGRYKVCSFADYSTARLAPDKSAPLFEVTT